MALSLRQTYTALFQEMKELSLLSGISGLLIWDQETQMPPAGAAERGEVRALMSGLMHARKIAPKVGQWLRQLSKNARKLSCDQQSQVREWHRDYKQSKKIPNALVRKKSRLQSELFETWTRAREANDFKAFAPGLQQMFALVRELAEHLGYKKHSYDALLDLYEPGMTVAKLDPLIDQVRGRLVPWLADIRQNGNAIDNAILKRRFPEVEQEALCKEMMGVLGMEKERSRLDRAHHPFSVPLNIGDVRITTRYNEHWLPASLYAMIHEAGHALYELGRDPRFPHTPLAESVSVGIHESQSRLWENWVGRSLPFARFIHPKLKAYFPQAMEGVSPEDFWRAINCVRAIPIRVESDELTYNLHIFIRYEIEKAFLTERVKVKELPSMWNDLMKTYLGVTPKNDAEGVLQDIHWSMGAIGYFPTYFLGNLYAAQLWERIVRDLPQIETQIQTGDFQPLLHWLRQKIHRQGRRYPPEELIRRTTGHPPTARPFLNYAGQKFSNLYGLRDLPQSEAA